MKCPFNMSQNNLFYFIGGIAAVIAGKAVAKSECVRQVAVKSLACGMKMQQEAAYRLETIKEDAQDLVQAENVVQEEIK